MKKTGILTLYYNNMNYGGLLQAFALPFVIQKHIGIPAEQIRYSCKDRKSKYYHSVSALYFGRNAVFVCRYSCFIDMPSQKNPEARGRPFASGN